MISISTTVSNPNGNVIITGEHASELRKKTARVSRTKTLDGGVYINHSGYTDGDRTLSVRARISAASAEALDAVFRLYTRVLVSMADGLYYGAIPSMTTENGVLKMTIYIEQKEN